MQQIFVIITLYQTSALIIQTSALTIPFYSNLFLHQHIMYLGCFTDVMNRCPEKLVRDLSNLTKHQKITLICNKDLVCHNQLTKSWQGPKLDPDTKCSLCRFQTIFFRTKQCKHSRWFTNYLSETMTKLYQYW